MDLPTEKNSAFKCRCQHIYTDRFLKSITFLVLFLMLNMLTICLYKISQQRTEIAKLSKEVSQINQTMSDMWGMYIDVMKLPVRTVVVTKEEE